MTHAEDSAPSYQASVDRAVTFLRSTGQAADGSFSAYAGPGVTAVVTTGLLRNGISPRDPLVAKSLEYLKGFVQPDGGIYQTGTLYRNYETCLAIMCFTEANRTAATTSCSQTPRSSSRRSSGTKTKATTRPTATAGPATASTSGPTCRTPTS